MAERMLEADNQCGREQMTDQLVQASALTATIPGGSHCGGCRHSLGTHESAMLQVFTPVHVADRAPT